MGISDRDCFLVLRKDYESRLYIWLLRKESSMRDFSWDFMRERVVYLNCDLERELVVRANIIFSRLVWEVLSLSLIWSLRVSRMLSNSFSIVFFFSFALNIFKFLTLRFFFTTTSMANYLKFLFPSSSTAPPIPRRVQATKLHRSKQYMIMCSISFDNNFCTAAPALSPSSFLFILQLLYRMH